MSFVTHSISLGVFSYLFVSFLHGAADNAIKLVRSYCRAAPRPREVSVGASGMFCKVIRRLGFISGRFRLTLHKIMFRRSASPGTLISEFAVLYISLECSLLVDGGWRDFETIYWVILLLVSLLGRSSSGFCFCFCFLSREFLSSWEI